MSQSVYKIITENGTFYAMFDTVIGQFVTRPYKSTSTPKLNGEKATEEDTLDLSSETLDKVDAVIAKLEVGKTLNKHEVKILSAFERFLDGTVAEHQYDYPETEQKILEGWISELKLREKFPDSNDEESRDFICDKALFPSYQERAIYPKRLLKELKRPSPNQNKLAGRYLRALATVGNIFGPNRSPIDQILLKFFKKLEGSDN